MWKKVAPRLSAGRVQSVSVRLLVKRERERRAFQKAYYWDLKAKLISDGKTFEAKLFSLKGKKVANGSDFDEKTGHLKKGNKSIILNEVKALHLVESLSEVNWRLEKLEKKPSVRRPVPPFTTSTCLLYTSDAADDC